MAAGTHIITAMNNPSITSLPASAGNSKSIMHLMHLISPSLPIGSFTYSQGIEWAVESDWINDADSLGSWLEGQIKGPLSYLDIPLLQRMYTAFTDDDIERLQYWCDYLQASRETRELLTEEKNRGRALTDLLIALGIPQAQQLKPLLRDNQLAAYCLAANRWQIPVQQAAQGYAWSWLENLILAAVKIIPLGQTAGQILLHELKPLLDNSVENGLKCDDSELGASSPALAIASSRHETQYTRLFRS